MDPFVVVTHPEPLQLEVRPVENAESPDGHVALGFYHHENLLARGAVPAQALDPLVQLLANPVTVALAVTRDEQGDVDGRFCVVLRMPGQSPRDSDEPAEPWKSSVPDLPPGVESEEPSPNLALLPLGNVVRSASNCRFPELADEASDMLRNLLAGRGRDAVARAIDDLLDSI